MTKEKAHIDEHCIKELHRRAKQIRTDAVIGLGQLRQLEAELEKMRNIEGKGGVNNEGNKNYDKCSQ
ncbi:hypothetical protein [Paenibacillus sacheonensis]|uniref:Uncharacterized protein n=1 Tax=Paenibacillus sacheonensis TaxID=742054 RepID=A0A7X5BX06_9BACL|nr:hypothetical protein [Paenibacillus sacheonensis]MBM7565264.1 uncharacterized protein YbjQ (UPF0145 family) [Paenibacillus sacheonensis]NBC69963.1 hypothetical protein [Paenibacillus sacheonensis]